MRDAFGGAFMIKLFIVFIIIYVGFTAVALNYAKAFKVKNLVITYLEENEISDLTDMPASQEADFTAYIDSEIVNKLGYIYKINSCNPNTETSKYKCYDAGIMIEQIEPNNNQKNKLGVYYKVTTYFGFQMPFFDRILALSGRNNGENIIGRWTITGETRTIAYE